VNAERGWRVAESGGVMAGPPALNFGNNPVTFSSYHSNQMGVDYVISDNMSHMAESVGARWTVRKPREDV